jgi:hypothetical protein
LEVNANADVSRSVADCRQAVSRQASAEAIIISSLPIRDRMIAASQYLIQKNDIALIAAATGRTVDPCRQTNLFDAQIAEVHEKTAQVKEGTGIARTAVRWVVGGLTINALADNIGSSTVQSYAVSDNGKVNIHSQNSGSDNTVNGDYQNNGVNNNSNSDCKDCDKAEETATADKIACSTDADCGEGQICSEGFCVDGAGVDPVEPEFDLKACQDNPPYGLNAYGTPLWTNGCSCVSHYNGQC